jgi:AraC-like DNA-binding protein
VELVWASDGSLAAKPAAPSKEIVLPSGATHLVFRTGSSPLRLYSSIEDAQGDIIGRALIGGPRTGPYIKDTTTSEPTVGVMLRPGAAELLLGTSAVDLAERHTNLEDVWPRACLDEIQNRLQSEPTLAGRLALIEQFLLACLPDMRGIDPLIMHSIEQFRLAAPIGEVVANSGFSHRYFTKVFTEKVGLRPKAYCRILRFSHVLDRIKADPDISSAELAIAEGYADQAHMNREFRAITSLTPGAYRRSAPQSPRHIPVR